MISRAASHKQIKAKNEYLKTFGNDTLHQRLNDLLSNCSISLARIFVILVSVLKSPTRDKILDS